MNKYIMIKKANLSLSLLLLICTAIILPATAEVKHEYPKSREERQADELGSILGAEGLSFNPKKIKNTSTESKTATANSYLWEATLEALSFSPLASTDAAGGVIITEWYIPKNDKNTSMKVIANIKGSTIEPINLEIKVYKRKKVKGEWVNENDASQALAQALEEKILRKARMLFLQSKGK